MISVFRLLGAVVMGVLLGTATFTSWLWPVAPVAIALILHLALSSASGRGAYVLGHAAGFGLMGAVFFWGFDALPLTWLGIDDPILGFFIMLFIWSVYSFLISGPVGVWAYGMHIVGYRPGLLIIAAPFGWVVGEYAHALLHVLTTWGGSSSLGFDLSFGFIGYALSWTGYLWLAQWGGVTMLSFILGVLGTSLYLLWRCSGNFSVRSRIAGVVAGSALIVLTGSMVPSPITIIYDPDIIETHGLRIVPLRTSVEPALQRTQDERRTIVETVSRQIIEVLPRDPDIIVLPEYVGYLKYESLLSKDVSSYIREELVSKRILLIDSERTAGDVSAAFGAISFFDGENLLAIHQKKLLIPLGEYFPYALVLIFSHIGLGAELDAILTHRTYAPSPDPFSERIFSWNGVVMGVLACSEVFSPFSYKEVSDAGAEVLINVASHAWVRGKSHILFREALAMARVHAVYTGKIYIQATNHGPSFVLHPRSLSDGMRDLLGP